MSAQVPASPRWTADEAHVHEALRRVSAAVWRAFVAAELGGGDAPQAVPAETPPPKERAADILPGSAAPSDQPSPTDGLLASGAASSA